MKNCKLTQHDMYTANALQMSNNDIKMSNRDMRTGTHWHTHWFNADLVF